MSSKPNTFLFGDFKIASVSEGKSKYKHTFGGPPDRRGTSREDCNGVLVHLLHRFNLDDPLIPIKIPNLSWLPLYYCFDYRVKEFGYRLLSEDELETYFIFQDDFDTRPKVDDLPFTPYPEIFPLHSMRVKKHPYNPKKYDDAIEWLRVFGTSQLSKKDQERARNYVREIAEFLGAEPTDSDEECDGFLCNPFMQGSPYGFCMNPECQNYEQKNSLESIVLTTEHPIKGVGVYGPGDHGGTQLIFQKCPLCHCVQTSNQCD